jgi:hypothetical protein
MAEDRQLGMFEESCADLPLWSGTPQRAPAAVVTRSAGRRQDAVTMSYLDDEEDSTRYRVAILRKGRAHPLSGTYPSFAKAWAIAEQLREEHPRTEYGVMEE